MANKLRALGNTFLNHRELLAQEAVYRLLSLPLRESSRHVVYIPTGFLHERTRILKPSAILQNMGDNTTDIFQPGILDKYAARPQRADIDGLCLAEFVANYGSSGRAADEDDDNDDDDMTDHQATGVQRSMRLLTGQVMVQRRKAAVIRYHIVPKDKDCQRYFYILLLLYLPWRNEEEDLLCDDDDYERVFEQNRMVVGQWQERWPSLRNIVKWLNMQFRPWRMECYQKKHGMKLLQRWSKVGWRT